jgi:hypothetical protein
MNIAIRRYHYLLMLKRAGAAHSDNGITDVTPGSLAIECPAAPLEGKNLPINWKEAYAGKP